eukprot:3192776-Prymnesium_polylepis.1
MQEEEEMQGWRRRAAAASSGVRRLCASARAARRTATASSRAASSATRTRDKEASLNKKLPQPQRLVAGARGGDGPSGPRTHGGDWMGCEHFVHTPMKSLLEAVT